MITLENVHFAYPHQPPLFSAFHWQAARGETWAVLGPSGCGKTTLLTLLAGLRMPQQGQVCVEGQPLERPRPATGLILQDFGLLPWATVRDNVTLGLRIRQLYGPDGRHAPTGAQAAANVDADQRARVWLERLGLADLIGQYPGQLSGGQRQRVAIARTLALQPDLLLMDEPFSALDAATRASLRDLTLNLWREEGFTFVVVTHAIEEAARLGQFILVLGRPPQRIAEVIVNPCFGESQDEESAAYRALLRELRARIAPALETHEAP